MVLASNDVGYALLVVVYDIGQVENRFLQWFGNHDVAKFGGIEFNFAPDLISENNILAGIF